MTVLYIVVAIAVVGLALHSFLIEPYRVRLHIEEIPIAGLPEALSGLTIVQLSDLHIRRYDRRCRLAIRIVHSLDPDLICLTGDFAHGNFSELTELLYKLRYKAPVYACIGNNDTDLDSLGECFAKTNCAILLDQLARYERGGQRLTILGIQPGTPIEQLRKLLEGTPRPRLILSHHPEIFDHLDDDAELVLAGHTHGGQCRLPLAGPILLYGAERLYSFGLFRKGRSALFVTHGIGTIGINARFLCPPEVVVLKLLPAQS